MTLTEVVNIAYLAYRLNLCEEPEFRDVDIQFHRGLGSEDYERHYLVGKSDINGDSYLLRKINTDLPIKDYWELQDGAKDPHTDWEIGIYEYGNEHLLPLTERMWFLIIRSNTKWNINGERFDPCDPLHQQAILTPDYHYDFRDEDLCRKTYFQLVAIDRFVEESARCSPHPDF